MGRRGIALTWINSIRPWRDDTPLAGYALTPSGKRTLASIHADNGGRGGVIRLASVRRRISATVSAVRVAQVYDRV